VLYRAGGHEDSPRYAGTFKTKREALIRSDWIAGEFAAMRVPDLRLLEAKAPTLREAADRWRASRVDVAESTRVLHRVALDRALPLLGDRPIDELAVDDVVELVSTLSANGRKARNDLRLRASVSKTRRALWVELPDELTEALEAELGPREDRDPAARLFAGSGADALRTSIAKACKALAIPTWSPHDLRHRRISLMHRQGRS
jgi:hypothetical protein